MGGHKLSDQAMADLGRMKRATIGNGPPQGPQDGSPHRDGHGWRWAKLASSMTAGTLESPTSTTVNFWVPNPADTAAHPAFIVSPDSALLGVSVSNRTDATGSTGLVVRVRFAYDEWTIVGANCA